MIKRMMHDILRAVPKGYVRLRCVDGPTGHKQLTGPYNGGGTDYDYAADTIYPKSQTYGVSTSESEVTSIHSEDGSDEDEQLSKLPERLKNAGGFPFPRFVETMHITSIQFPDLNVCFDRLPTVKEKCYIRSEKNQICHPPPSPHHAMKD